MTMLMLMTMLMFVKVFMFVYAGGIFVRIGVHVFNGKMNSANAAFFGGSAANIQSDGREGSCNIPKLGTLFFGKQIIECARKHIARRTHSAVKVKCFHSKKAFQQFYSGLHIIIKKRIVTAHCCRCRYGLSCLQGNLRRSRCRYSQRILRLSRS